MRWKKGQMTALVWQIDSKLNKKRREKKGRNGMKKNDDLARRQAVRVATRRANNIGTQAGVKRITSGHEGSALHTR